MGKYVFVYHGGGMPESPEEGEKAMAAWGAWFGSLGEAVLDGGNPTGAAKTVNANGSVVAGGGTNPASGYSLVRASSLDEAVKMAQGCPILANGGSVEVAETIDM